MGFKKWLVANYDKELAKALAEDCDVDPIVALIATARGYEDPCELEQFLSDELYFSDPYSMADIEKASDIINAAIENNEKIAVYGDYDCDGITATVILYRYLKHRGADCCYYIPDRFEEGYGMNSLAVKNLAQKGVKLIVTVDNGIVCFEEIKLAKELGLKVVVTDHHLPSDTLPEADAVVDPHRADCPSDFKSVCGAEVAFRLICVMENKEPEELIFEYCDLLSLAVTADIMPLILENRSIIKCGIEKIKKSASVGITSLLSVAGIEKESINSGRIAFGLVPRINAAGRMGKAERAVELLLCENMMAALELANEIDAENSLRQQTEKSILEEALCIVEKENLANNRVIVACGKGWHHGVLGIVASRLSERFEVPVILLSSDGEIATGSGRSIEGFSLYNALSYCKELLMKFGGHDLAAGVTVSAEKVAEFRKKINEYARNTTFVPPVLSIDCKLKPSALSLDLAFAIKQLEPFGVGNANPVFGIYETKLERITPIANNKHLRLLFSKGENSFQCLLFGVGSEGFPFEVGDVLDLAVTVDTNYYKGEYSLTVQIKAIRVSGTDDDKLFYDIKALRDFLSVGKTDAALLPEREDVGRIYRYISEHQVTEEKLKYVFMNSIGYGKTAISVLTMRELGLIEKLENGRFKVIKNSVKTNLTNSSTYKLLIEGSGRDE